MPKPELKYFVTAPASAKNTQRNSCEIQIMSNVKLLVGNGCNQQIEPEGVHLHTMKIATPCDDRSLFQSHVHCLDKPKNGLNFIDISNDIQILGIHGRVQLVYSEGIILSPRVEFRSARPLVYSLVLAGKLRKLMDRRAQSPRYFCIKSSSSY